MSGGDEVVDFLLGEAGKGPLVVFQVGNIGAVVGEDTFAHTLSHGEAAGVDLEPFLINAAELCSCVEVLARLVECDDEGSNDQFVVAASAATFAEVFVGLGGV